MLVKACDEAFDTDIGRRVERQIFNEIDAFSMKERIKQGVIVGFSGGADSVLLLIFLQKLRKRFYFTLKAVHVNHCIRGADADSDETFCREFCNSLGIDFQSFKIDIPKKALEKKIGIEEVARDERYSTFRKIIEEFDEYNTIATAHNSTDNLETFIFNLMRGSGAAGLCGIPPVRDNIIRPILSVSKEDVILTLNESNVPFVTDKTNFSTEYTRNYIRHEILPKLKKLSDSPEESCSRAISNLRSDNDYILSVANEYFKNSVKDGKADSQTLSQLHPAVFARVIRLMAKELSDTLPEKSHIEKIWKLLKHSSVFEVYLPGSISFVRRGMLCYVTASEKKEALRFDDIILHDGPNYIPQLDVYILLSDSKNENFSSNVYKFAIQADLQSAIICGSIKIRQRKDGDSYFYGGMTRKVKKLFNDKKIPADKRDQIPIFCDGNGILWIPGFGVRNDNPDKKTKKFITIYKSIDPSIF